MTIEPQWVDRLKDIPTLPSIAMKVCELLQKPSSSTPEVADLLRGDQVLTAKILRLANSSFYSIPGGVSDVTKALSFLGYNTIAQLALGLSVFSSFEQMESSEFSMTEFWKHSLAVAFFSEILAKNAHSGFHAQAFTCGLLHDIGKLALFKLDPEMFLTVVKKAKNDQLSFFEAEHAIGSPSHSALGAALATRWNLPSLIIETIKFHHEAKPENSFIEIISKANFLSHQFHCGHSGNYQFVTVDPTTAEPLEKELASIQQKTGAFLSAVR